MPPHLAAGHTQTVPALIALPPEEQLSVLLQSMGVGMPVCPPPPTLRANGVACQEAVSRGSVVFRRRQSCLADKPRTVISSREAWQLCFLKQVNCDLSDCCTDRLEKLSEAIPGAGGCFVPIVCLLSCRR